jgi:hypothetical protein
VRCTAGVVLCGALVAVVVLLTQWASIHSQLQALRDSSASLQAPHPAAPRVAGQSRFSQSYPGQSVASQSGSGQSARGLTAEQRKALQAVVHQLNLPWSDILSQLEATLPANVALLELDTEGHTGTLTIQAQARSLDTLLQFAGALEQQGVFGRLLYRQHDTDTADPNRPVRLRFALALRTAPLGHQP